MVENGMQVSPHLTYTPIQMSHLLLLLPQALCTSMAPCLLLDPLLQGGAR